MTRRPKAAAVTTVLPTLVALLEGSAYAQSVPQSQRGNTAPPQAAVDPRPWRHREARVDGRHGRGEVRYRPNRQAERVRVYESEVVMGAIYKVTARPVEPPPVVKKDDDEAG